MEKSFIVNLGPDPSDEIVVKGRTGVYPSNPEAPTHVAAIIIDCKDLLAWFNAKDETGDHPYTEVGCQGDSGQGLVHDQVVIYGLSGDFG